LRGVKPEGVATVMDHFFAGLNMSAPARNALAAPGNKIAARKLKRSLRAEHLACEEAMLEAMNAH
jgi:hypothetical protein